MASTKISVMENAEILIQHNINILRAAGESDHVIASTLGTTTRSQDGVKRESATRGDRYRCQGRDSRASNSQGRNAKTADRHRDIAGL